MIPFIVGFWQKIVTTLTCWFTLDGVNEYITIPHDDSLNFDNTDSFSISQWVNQNRTTGGSILVSKGNDSNSIGYQTVINTKDNFIQFQLIHNGSNQIIKRFNVTLNDSQWYHIIFTYDGSSDASGVKAYVDGVEITTVTIFSNTLTLSSLNTNPFNIGSRNNLILGPDYEYDELSVWNTDLTSTEVSDIYNLGRSEPDLSTIDSYTHNCISHWRMSENDTYTTPNWDIYDEVRREWTNLDGVNEYISIPHSASIDFERTDTFSYSIWFNNAILNWYFPLFNKNNSSGNRQGIQFWLRNDNKFHIVIQADNSPVNRAYARSVETLTTTNVWNHFVVSYDGSSSANGIKMYLNGTLLTNNILNNNLTKTIQNTLPLTIGTNNAVSLYSEGGVDEALVFNTEITSTDVTDIYNRGRYNPEYSDITGIVSHWKMDALDPIDQIGNNDGTSINQDSNNLKNDINDGTSVNMDETNKQCE